MRAATRFASAATLAILVFFQAGCALVTYSVQEDRLPGPTARAMVGQWPVAVGVHYGPGVRDAHIAYELWQVRIGAGVTATFSWALRQMFTEVVELHELPPGRAAPAGIAGIVMLTSVPNTRTPEAVTYDVELRAPDGSRLDEWTVHGTAWTGDPPEHSLPGTRVTWAIRDATASFMVRFADRPAVHDWLVGAGAAIREGGPTYSPAAMAPPWEAGVLLVPGSGFQGYGDASYARQCVGSRLEEMAPPIRIVPFDRFRLAFFPWLEHSIAPATEEDVLRFVAHPVVHQKLEELNVRYLIRFSGRTTTNLSRGGIAPIPYAGFWGFTWGTRHSAFTVAVIDVREAVAVARKSASREAGVYVPAVVLPVPIIGATESAACQELAEHIHGILTGKLPPGRPQPEPQGLLSPSFAP